MSNQAPPPDDDGYLPPSDDDFMGIGQDDQPIPPITNDYADPDIGFVPQGENGGDTSDHRPDLAKEAETFLRDIDEQIDDDPGWLGLSHNINLMARMSMHHKESYYRLLQVLKFRKIARQVQADINAEVARIKREETALGPRLIYGTGHDDPNDKRLRIKYELPQAPCSETDKVPDGWDFGRNGQADHDDGGWGVFRIVHKKIDGEIVSVREPVIRGYLVIAARICNVVTDQIMLDIAYSPLYSGHRWIHAIVAQWRLGSPQDLAKELLEQGIAGINAVNARDVAQFLSDYLVTNTALINRKMVSSQMGWVDERMGFLLGETNIGSSLTKFYALDAGEKQMSDALQKTKGTLEGWANMAAMAAKYPAIEIGIYASLCAPLLDILDVPNFIFEWVGQTSTGKSIALGVAASVWGPPKTYSNGIVGSWGGTKIGIERRMAALSHLPTILDDTKTVRSFGARGDNMIPSVIYMATSGMGDARGTTEGTQKALSWRTVLICTGEQKITSFDKSAGTVARVLSLWGSPFGGYSDDAMAISDACDEHYGHAGRAFLEWVINETKADENVAIQWREQCKTIRAELLAKMIEYGNDKGVTQRLAAPLAAIEMTARLVHRALNLPWKYISPIEKLYPNMAKESSSAQRHEEAYGHMISWINSNRSKIENHAMSADHEPHGGWIGIYIRDSSRLAINKDQLDKFLRQNRFEPLSTYRMWRETNMIVTDKNKTTIKIHSGDYEGERMVCLRVTPEIESIFNPSTGESNASETHHSEPNRHHEPADQDDQETLW